MASTETNVAKSSGTVKVVPLVIKTVLVTTAHLNRVFFNLSFFHWRWHRDHFRAVPHITIRQLDKPTTIRRWFSSVCNDGVDLYASYVVNDRANIKNDRTFHINLA
jgi:hypothetical protein